jgi:polysaccharide export outer membrane protein
MKSSLVLMIVLTAGTALAADWPWHHSKPKQSSTPPSPTAVVDPPALAPDLPGPSYLIGAEDTLHISVWKEPDLSATLPVRSDGKISLPLLNDVPAAGLTPMQLAASLTEKLKKYVEDPRVTVVVAQMNSQKIFVTGEVQRTGAMQLLPNMTVLQALASSGLTQFANTKKIYVLRSLNGVQQRLPVNYKQLVKGRDMAQNVALKPGDTIVVP